MPLLRLFFSIGIWIVIASLDAAESFAEITMLVRSAGSRRSTTASPRAWRRASGAAYVPAAAIAAEPRNGASPEPLSLSSSVYRIPESIWRPAAELHHASVYELLRPGLLEPNDTLNAGRRPNRSRQHKQHPEEFETSIRPVWTALDPKHPVYNFLIEYYGQKGIGPVVTGTAQEWSVAGRCDRIRFCQ